MDFISAQEADSIKYGFLPGFSYNSDNGVNIYLELQRFVYNEEILPFKSFGKYWFNYSGIGAYTFSMYRDQVQTFGTDKRSSFDLLVSQNYGNYFPGYTVNENFSKEKFDTTSYYQFDSFLLNIGVETRVPISDIIGIKRTDIKLGLRVVYEKPFGVADTAYLNDFRPVGWQGSTYSFLELGYIKERRDNEFRSQNGYLASVSFKTSLPFISETTIGQLYSEFRWFREITKREQTPQIVFAQRFLINQTFGDIPYWFAPSLGGGGSLRGYIYRRFVGNGVVQSNTELRSWLVKLPWFESRLGFNLFWDNGAVYDKSLKNWQKASTVGFGGFMSLFSQDYILKYEMGFSKEGIGIYVGSGFSF